MSIINLHSAGQTKSIFIHFLYGRSYAVLYKPMRQRVYRKISVA